MWIYCIYFILHRFCFSELNLEIPEEKISSIANNASTKLNATLPKLRWLFLVKNMLNPIKFENCNKCRMELGIVGGTAASHIQGNIVDLEALESARRAGDVIDAERCLADAFATDVRPRSVRADSAMTYGIAHASTTTALAGGATRHSVKFCVRSRGDLGRVWSMALLALGAALLGGIYPDGHFDQVHKCTKDMQACEWVTDNAAEDGADFVRTSHRQLRVCTRPGPGGV